MSNFSPKPTPCRSQTINGQIGPFQYGPGAYGANAAWRAQRTCAQNLVNTHVRISPANTVVQGKGLNCEGLNNYFGYAEIDMAPIDKNCDGRISQQELFQAFGGNRQRVQQFFNAFDINHDCQIDVAEHATYLMLQDAPTEAFKCISPELDCYFSQVQDYYKAKGLCPTAYAFDGNATVAERHITEDMLNDCRWNPHVAYAAQKIYQQLCLGQQYQNYCNTFDIQQQQQQAQPAAPQYFAHPLPSQYSL